MTPDRIRHKMGVENIYEDLGIGVFWWWCYYNLGERWQRVERFDGILDAELELAWSRFAIECPERIADAEHNVKHWEECKCADCSSEKFERARMIRDF